MPSLGERSQIIRVVGTWIVTDALCRNNGKLVETRPHGRHRLIDRDSARGDDWIRCQENAETGRDASYSSAAVGDRDEGRIHRCVNRDRGRHGGPLSAHEATLV